MFFQKKFKKKKQRAGGGGAGNTILYIRFTVYDLRFAITLFRRKT